MWIPKCGALIRVQCLFEARRLLEEIRYSICNCCNHILQSRKFPHGLDSAWHNVCLKCDIPLPRCNLRMCILKKFLSHSCSASLGNEQKLSTVRCHKIIISILVLIDTGYYRISYSWETLIGDLIYFYHILKLANFVNYLLITSSFKFFW